MTQNIPGVWRSQDALLRWRSWAFVVGWSHRSEGEWWAVSETGDESCGDGASCHDKLSPLAQTTGLWGLHPPLGHWCVSWGCSSLLMGRNRPQIVHLWGAMGSCAVLEGVRGSQNLPWSTLIQHEDSQTRGTWAFLIGLNYYKSNRSYVLGIFQGFFSAISSGLPSPWQIQSVTTNEMRPRPHSSQIS